MPRYFTVFGSYPTTPHDKMCILAVMVSLGLHLKEIQKCPTAHCGRDLCVAHIHHAGSPAGDQWTNYLFLLSADTLGTIFSQTEGIL